MCTVFQFRNISEAYAFYDIIQTIENHNILVRDGIMVMFGFAMVKIINHPVASKKLLVNLIIIIIVIITTTRPYVIFHPRAILCTVVGLVTDFLVIW